MNRVIIDLPCTHCRAPIGEHHEPGCPREPCPSCGAQIITCLCGAIDVKSESIIERGLIKYLGTFDVAVYVVYNSPDGSLLHRAAMGAAIDLGPPELRDKVSEGIRTLFPNLEPLFVDEEGEAQYSLADVARELGQTEQEVFDRCQGLGILHHCTPESLHRIN